MRQASKDCEMIKNENLARPSLIKNQRPDRDSNPG